MKENKQQLEEQLSAQFSKQQNFFFETISTKLKGYKQFEEHSIQLLDEVGVSPDLTLEQFELLGSLCYLVGIDYTNQPYLKKDVCVDKVYARFKVFEFSDKLLMSFVEALSKTTEKNCQKAKDELKNQITNVIKIADNYKLEYFNIQKYIKGVVDNSIIAINFSLAIKKIISSKNMTFDDLLKINSFLTNNCKFLGNKAIKNMMKLYSSELFVKLLSEAMLLFDNQKYAIIYLDGILSINESKNKFPSSDSKKNIDWNLYNVLTGRISDTMFQEYEDNFKSKIEQESVKEEIKPETEVSKMSQEEITELSTKDQVQFVFNIIEDLLGHKPITSDDHIKAIELLIQESDYSQNVYHFIKANLVKMIENHTVNQDNLNIYSDILKRIEITLEGLKTGYKISAEKMFQDINEDCLDRIVNYVNICIGDLVLDNPESKQYLMSQLTENGIITYNHLKQIVSLIESCDIIGSQISSYEILYNYLKENTLIKEIFEESNNIDKLQLKISLWMAFEKFYQVLSGIKPNLGNPQPNIGK